MRRSLWTACFMALAVIFSFTNLTIAQDDFPSDRSVSIVYDHGGTVLDIPGVQTLDLVAPYQNVTSNSDQAQSIIAKPLPVGEVAIRFEPRNRWAYWPIEKTRRTDTKGYSQLIADRLAKGLEKLV